MVRTPADTDLLVDVMCGKLATYLRVCGYDTVYALDRGVQRDETLLTLAREEDRLLLTRDQSLAERAAERGLYLEPHEPRDQLRCLDEMGFELQPQISRCSLCNGPLEEVPSSSETPSYAPAADVAEVWRCQRCDQHYWRGSHWADMVATLQEL